MIRLEVDSASGKYPVVLGHGVLTSLPAELFHRGFSMDTKVVVITDETVATTPLLSLVVQSLDDAGLRHHLIVVPAGDATKNLTMATDLYRQLVQASVRRKDVIVALGGGVVGDLAGFVAATYLRGVSFLQAPTTLLAHDSSLGGKVGVNLEQGKNLVGAFAPPIAVLYDLDAFRTLPPRQWRNGMAEIIKHAIIGNSELFAQLEKSPMTSFIEDARVESMVAQAMQVKIDVVEADEHEQGERQVLNVGHTLGHALEQQSNYVLGHGEAISIGLVLEAALAVRRGILNEADAKRIGHLLARHGLPIRPSATNFSALEKIIDVDKKHGSTNWTFALPVAIGRVDIFKDVQVTEVEAVYQKVIAEVTQ